MEKVLVPPPMDRNERRRRARLSEKLYEMHGMFTRESRKSIANRALAFFKDAMFYERPRLATNVHVTLHMSKNLDAMGYCDYDDDESRPRDFRILLDRSIDKVDIVETIAHEMVHVWQFATGKLVDLADGRSKYDGHKYDRDDMPYGELPWEVEAYGMEEGLIRLWIDNEKKRGSVGQIKGR